MPREHQIVCNHSVRLNGHKQLNQLNASTMVAAFFSLLAIIIPFSYSQADTAQSETSHSETTVSHAAANLKPIDIKEGFAELVKAVKPAVVNISITGSLFGGPTLGGEQFGLPEGRRYEFEEFFKRFFEFREDGRPRDKNAPHDKKPYQRKTTAAGSGFVIDPDGLVVTNNHVIENADEIEVVFDDGKRLPATVKGVDKKTDLALLQVKSDQPLAYVEFGNSVDVEVGDWIIAIGNPFGLGGSTTSGIVSARGRDINSGPLDDFIQLDAPINRGNSGGPLFNTKGQVIGVNSAIFSPNGGSVGIGFAIPSNQAAYVVQHLADSGVVQRGFLGVHIQSVDDEIAESLGLDRTMGALVTKVINGSPASKAGVEAGDVIVKYDDKEVMKMRDLPKLVANTGNNQKVSMDVWRNNETVILSAVIGYDNSQQVALDDADNKETPSNNSNLGLVLAQLNDELRERYGIENTKEGVVITDVNPNGTAARKGLREGDLIKRVGKTTVKAPEEVKKAIRENQEENKKSILLLIERDKNSRYVVVPLI